MKKIDLMLWVRATRAPFVQAAFIPVILGFSISYYETGQFLFGFFAIALLSNIFINIGANMMNDYYDELSGNDRANSNFTKFSGGSRLIQDGIMTKETYFKSALVFYGLGALGGIFLALQGRPLLFVIGLFGILFSFLYTAKPIKLAYRGFGELTVFTLFGPISVIGASYVNNPTITLSSFYLSLPIALLVGLILFINEFPDFEADKAVKKNTLVVIMGLDRSKYVYAAFVVLTYITLILLVLSGFAPALSLLALITLPLGIAAIKGSMQYESRDILIGSMENTIKLHLAFGVLMSIGFIFSKIF